MRLPASEILKLDLEISVSRILRLDHEMASGVADVANLAFCSAFPASLFCNA